MIGAPRASSPSANVSTLEQKDDSIYNIASSPEKEDVRQAPELSQASLQEDTEPMSVTSTRSAKSRPVD